MDRGGRPFGLELLDDDLDALAVVVDVEERAAEAAGDAFAEGVGVEEALGSEAAGEGEAGIDEAEGDREVEGGATAGRVRDADADVSGETGRVWRIVGREGGRVEVVGAVSAVEGVEEGAGFIGGDGATFEHLEDLEAVLFGGIAATGTGEGGLGHGRLLLD
jgi:hypothetical protein